MDVRIFVIPVFVLISRIVFAQRGSPCVTPNNETATCMRMRSCQVITDAIQTKDEGAMDFANESHCGYDMEALVCCGSSGYYKLPSFSDIFTTTPDAFDDIFTKALESSTEASKQQEATINNFNVNGLPDKTVCGLDSGTMRIIGGEATEMDEFPWMAALEYKNARTGDNVGIRCGGTLINNRYVLTAAHCIVNNEFELIRVWLGEWILSTDPDCDTFLDTAYCADPVMKLKISESIPYPFYSSKSRDNDIGLLRLEKDIQYSEYIRPICLPQADLPPVADGTNLTISGWGATENGTLSDIKLKVSVPLISNAKCEEKLSTKLGASKNQLCAGGIDGKDSCRGDSGGPLMRLYEDKAGQQLQWYQEGVVSHGVGCGRVGFPAIYTRVSKYTTWIINMIKPV